MKIVNESNDFDNVVADIIGKEYDFGWVLGYSFHVIKTRTGDGTLFLEKSNDSENWFEISNTNLPSGDAEFWFENADEIYFRYFRVRYVHTSGVFRAQSHLMAKGIG